MKKSIRVLSLILVLALFAFMAMGSGSKSGTENVQAPSSVTTGDQNTETPKPADTSEPAATPTSSPSQTAPSSTPATPAPTPTASTAVTVQEGVIFEQDGIRITLKGFDEKGLFGPELKFLIENDTDMDIIVQTRNESVNGYMIDASMSAEVASGKKANDGMTLMKSDITRAGIKTIADIEFSFYIFDDESWDTICESDMIRVETSAADGFEYTYDDSGDLAYNGNGVEIVIKGLSEKDSWLGPSVVVYISNTSSRNVMVQTRDVSINGFMIDPYFSPEVAAGKRAIDSITFSSTDLEENDIEKIESIELSFHIFDSDSWNAIADTEVVTINFD